MELPSTPQNFKTFWPKGTCAVIGGSMMSGLKENFLSKNGSIKERPFPESTVDHMFFNVVPVLKKRPSYLIIHVETNNATNHTSNEL